mgnify:CR=1 FL=1
MNKKYSQRRSIAASGEGVNDPENVSIYHTHGESASEVDGTCFYWSGNGYTEENTWIMAPENWVFNLGNMQ